MNTLAYLAFGERVYVIHHQEAVTDNANKDS